MNLFTLTFQEILHRKSTSLLTLVLVIAITGTITFFIVNSRGFEKEIGRNVRDIGSNIVILPAEVDQFAYHQQGGFSERTMPAEVVDQLIEFRASLNHLIPMLEQTAPCQYAGIAVNARVVGISASIPVPGRPKAPMQKSIAAGKVQLGAELARSLGVDREAKQESVRIAGTDFEIDRVNRSNGTWQDSAAILDLQTAQTLFELPGQISRIEAIECTQEKCEATGLQSDVVLTNELAGITDRAVLLRREQMAQARLNVRELSHQNVQLLKNLLWVFLALALMALAALNTLQRRSEIGILQAVGYGQTKVAALFVLRALFLGLAGAVVGVVVGSLASLWQSKLLFTATGRKFSIDWNAGVTVALVAIALSVMAALIPALISASQHPADLIGKER